MGRSVEDVVTLLNVQSGFDPRDPSSFESDAIALDPAIVAKGGRIGWLGDFGGHLPFEPGVLELNEKALGVFRKLGFAVEPVRVDFDMERLWWAWTTLRSYFTAGSMRDFYEDPGRRGSLKPEILYEVRSGLRIHAADVYEASAVRTAWYQALAKVFETYDFLVAPAAQVFPFDADIPWPREIAGKHMDTYHRWMEVVIGPSMAGLPVAALPAGFSPQGLPSGFQLIGKPRADQAVLSVARPMRLRPTGSAGFRRSLRGRRDKLPRDLKRDMIWSNDSETVAVFRLSPYPGVRPIPLLDLLHEPSLRRP